MTTAVWGRTLGSWWPTMNEEMKSRCISQVIEVCKKLTDWAAGYIVGVGKQTLADSYLAGRDHAYTNDDLVATSREIGMGCSVPFYLYHCDLWPGSLIGCGKEDKDDDRSISISIIDWEIAGFVPWEWILIRFRVSTGLDLPWEYDSRLDYRHRVKSKVGELRFPDIAGAFFAGLGQK